MNSKALVAIVVGAVVAVVFVVALRRPHAPAQSAPLPGSAAADSAPAPTATPEAARTPPVSSEPAAAPAPVVEATAASRALAPPEAEGEWYEGKEHPTIGPGEIKDLLEKLGLEKAYQVALPDHRRDIIDYLARFDQLRLSLPSIIGLESDPEMRAYMLEGTVPLGMEGKSPAELAAAPPEKDLGLVALLKQEPPTPMGSAEWVRRMDLARQVDAAEALSFARDSARRFPEDREIAVVASEAILAAATSDASSGSEATDAREVLFDILGRGEQPELREINSDFRLRSYRTLAADMNAPGTREFLERQLVREADPRLRKALEAILAQ